MGAARIDRRLGVFLVALCWPPSYPVLGQQAERDPRLDRVPTLIGADLDGDGRAFQIGGVIDLFIVVWRSEGPIIPWADDSPATTCEAAVHVIWSAIQAERNRKSLFPLEDKPSVIGHAALYARHVSDAGKETEFVFSNTGGNVGVTTVAPTLEGLQTLPFLARINVAEALAGHRTDGRWEKLTEFRKRVRKRKKPRVKRLRAVGPAAEILATRLYTILRDTIDRYQGPGGPRDYGLNTLAVRRLDSFDQPRAVRDYGWKFIPDNFPHSNEGPRSQIHGGCANAVASVLRSVWGDPAVIPDCARVERTLAIGAFKDANLPIPSLRGAFNSTTGKARDEDLVNALEALPEHWGTGDRLVFYEPNYWHDGAGPDYWGSRKVEQSNYAAFRQAVLR